MTKWKQIKLSEAKKYTSFFVESCGLISRCDVSVRLVDSKGELYRWVYTDKSPYGSSKATERYAPNGFDFTKDFDTKYYTLNQSGSNKYHSYHSTVLASDTQKIEPCYLVTWTLNVRQNSDYGYSRSETRETVEKVVKNKQEFEEFTTLWATTNTVDGYAMLTYVDLKLGQKYLYVGKGLCEVVKMYDYPMQNSKKICKVKLLNGETMDVDVGDTHFVLNPLEQAPNELDQFNTTLNELALQPVVDCTKNGNLINVFWQPIEDAARYVVKLYLKVNTPNARNVYFLCDYDVERNKHFLSINDVLVNSNLIIVVTAEDRSGKIIAQSRGISVTDGSGRPIWWN